MSEVPGHAYAVLAYDKAKDEVLLRNAWGNTVPMKMDRGRREEGGGHSE